MRKLLVAVTVASMSAALGLAGVALAGAKAPPRLVTAHVTPPHREHAPYKYRVQGNVVPPDYICPAGVTNLKYCTKTPPGACRGRVRITFRLGDNPYLRKSGQVVLDFVVGVNKRCRYDSKERTIDKGDLTADRAFRGRGGRFVKILVDVRFLGNAYLTPGSSRTNVVFAKLTPHS